MNEQIFMGTLFAVVCLTGMIQADWVLAHSRQCQKLVEKWGTEIVRRYLQIVLLCGVLLGILLATNIIRPIRWESDSAVQTMSQ